MAEPGNKELEALIPLINKLQDVSSQMGVPVGFDLPQIAVVGGKFKLKYSVISYNLKMYLFTFCQLFV